MLRTGLTTALMWLIVLGTPVLAHSPDDDNQVVATCAEVLAIAKPLMPVDAFEQLLVLSEVDCMTAFGGYTHGELRSLLSKEPLYVSVDEDGITYTKRPKPPVGMPGKSLSHEPDACTTMPCKIWQWGGFTVWVLIGFVYLLFA